jgi:glycosyltransferase involved in cell wall biosynthesis
MTRIVQIVPSLEERHGGPSKSVRALSAAQAALGNDVLLLATGPGPDERREYGSLSIETFHRDRPVRVCPSRGLRRRLAGVAPDVVHHHALWLRTLHYARNAARAARVPLVVSPRGMMNPWGWKRHRWRKWVAANLVHPGALEAVGGWHATSAAEADAIVGLGFRQPVCVAPNGVEKPAAATREAAAVHWRSICPEAASRPVALFYSRFHARKRVIELIDLWLEHGPKDWLLMLVGIPESHTPAELEDYAYRSGGAGRVRAYDGANQPPPYAVATLFLLPSDGESFGLVVAEALANGVPVLVTDGAPWGGVDAAGAGWCVPWARFPEALRAATEEGPGRLRARGAAGRDWVLREFSWEKPARDLVEFYGRLRA